MIDVFLDFETYYDRVYSLRKMTTQQFIMDERFEAQMVSIALDDGPMKAYVGDEIEPALREIDWSKANLVCHNTQFDGAILAWRYDIRPKLYSCTLSMSRAIFGSMLKSVGLFDVAQLLGMHKDKGALQDMLGVRLEDMDRDSPEFRRWFAYGGQDTIQCREIYRLIMQRFPPGERIVVDQIMRMYIDGSFKLDMDMLRAGLFEDQLANEELFRRAGIADVKELRSRDKFAELLRSHGVEPPTKISPANGQTTFAFAANDTEFTALLEHENPMVATLVEAKLASSSNLSITRAQRFIEIGEQCDRELHVPLLYSGAHTHRFSGLDKLNLQNMPRDGSMRKALRAHEGKKLVGVDASQIEARFVAWLARQMDLVDAFLNRRDVYAEFATKVYQRPINKHDDPLERFIGKQGILGLGYGASAPKFHFMLTTMSTQYDGSPEFSAGVVETYRSGYANIPELWRKFDGFIENMHTGNTVQFGPLVFGPKRIILPSGLSINFPKLRRAEGYDKVRDRMKRGYEYHKPRYNSYTSIYGAKLLENCCQALARVQITDVMIKIAALRPHWTCLLQVHDELIYEVPEAEAEECRVMVTKMMADARRWNQYFDWPLPLDAEGGVADSYGEIKKKELSDAERQLAAA